MLKDISIVVPFNNEEKSVDILYSNLKNVLDSLGKDYELIFVDDGSSDGTYDHLNRIYSMDRTVNIIRLTKNFGQTSALSAGFNFARGEIIITMDGDLQHDPGDIPKFLEKIYLGYDLVSGWKRMRKDNFLTKRIPSVIANRLISFLFGKNFREVSSTFKAYRRNTLEDITLFGELHRFIPLLIKKKDISVCEIEIDCDKRKHGKTHYGLGRTWRVIRDILLLWITQGDIAQHSTGRQYSIQETQTHP